MAIPFQSARQIWVWPNITRFLIVLVLKTFQSARQIWVWPNDVVAFDAVVITSVSICQADLGLAEHNVIAHPRIVNCGFNLPGRFGFGRTWGR